MLLKTLVLPLLPVPLVLWLVLSIVGSLLVGIGYGLFAPLAGTLQAVGAKEDKFYHCLVVRSTNPEICCFVYGSSSSQPLVLQSAATLLTWSF